jgi:hypothetical protein
MDQTDVYKLLLVALLWGVTNPLLKRGADAANRPPSSSSSSAAYNFFMELFYTITNYKYFIPFAINQVSHRINLLMFFIL